MRPIDADDFKKLIEKLTELGAPYAEIVSLLDQYPTIDERPKEKGKWIIDGIYQYCIPIWRSYYPTPLNYYKCSRCNGGSKVQFNFCPHCGEAMEVEENDI